MKVKFTFNNIDNSLYTKEECSVTMDIEADNEQTAQYLAMHLKKVLGADHFDFVNLDLIKVTAEQDAEIKKLQKAYMDEHWVNNPDRSGGQFTQDEIDNAGRWL